MVAGFIHAFDLEFTLKLLQIRSLRLDTISDYLKRIHSLIHLMNASIKCV